MQEVNRTQTHHNTFDTIVDVCLRLRIPQDGCFSDDDGWHTLSLDLPGFRPLELPMPFIVTDEVLATKVYNGLEACLDQRAEELKAKARYVNDSADLPRVYSAIDKRTADDLE